MVKNPDGIYSNTLQSTPKYGLDVGQNTHIAEIRSQVTEGGFSPDETKKYRSSLTRYQLLAEADCEVQNQRMNG
jgi:hypothetical protein